MTIPNNAVLTIIESPYAAESDALLEHNVHYARRCLRDSICRGEAPIASHLLYTQSGVLRDDVPEERHLGIAAGLAWLGVAERHVFYTDLGWSRGMLDALALSDGVEICLRSIDGELNLPGMSEI